MPALKRYLFVIMGLILIVSSLFFYNYFYPLVGVVSFISGIISIFISIWQTVSNKKLKEEYETIIQIYREQNKQLLEKYEEVKDEKTKESLEKQQLRKILDKINETLKKENISKEDLLEKLDSPLFTIIIQKYNEPQKRIQSRLLSLGFKTFGQGIYILPPVKADFIKKGFDLKKWIHKHILKGLPKDYKYIIKFAAIVDMRKMICDKQLVTKAQTYLDVLSIDDLMSPQQIINYLKTKRNISLKDIIELPNIAFLVEEYLTSRKDYEMLKRNNDKILSEIKREIKVDEIKTTDLGSIDEEKLSEILKKYVSEPEKIAKRIKMNSIFWRDVFSNKLTSSQR